MGRNCVSVVGSGDLESAAQARFGPAYLGPQDRDGVMAPMQRSSWLVAPSIGFEPFGVVVVEAYAAGLPVIASRIGSSLSCSPETGSFLVRDES